MPTERDSYLSDLNKAIGQGARSFADLVTFRQRPSVPTEPLQTDSITQRLLGIDPRNLPRDELSRALERQTLAPGLTVVGQRSQPVQIDQGRELLTQAADSNTGVRRVSVTEPDGRTIQVEGSTPFDIASLLEGRESSAIRGGTETAALPEGQQIALPEGPQEAPTSPERGGLLGILERAGRAAGTPRGQILLGSIAEAIGGNSTGGRLGSVARQLGEARVAQEVSQATQQGKETPESASALSPELQQQAVRTGLALRGAKTEEERAKILNEYTQAQTAATATVEQQRETALLLEETRQNNRLELQKAEEASRIAVGEALDNRWMKAGEFENHAVVFNWKTGEIRTFSLGEPGKSSRVENINSADYKQMLSFTAQNFIPQVWEKYKKEMKELGFESLVDIQKAFTEPESGTVNPELILARLDPVDRRNFADILMRFTVEGAAGVPRSATLSNIIAEESRILKPGDVEKGYRYIGPVTEKGSKESATSTNWEKLK